MGKCCAVDGCLSGRKASEHLGKVALFKAPKDIEMLSKWSSALGKELKNTNFICELHFNPNDVIKSNQEVLKDGSIYFYEYEKVHLKKNAIPKSNVITNENNYSLLSDDVRSNTSGIINDDITVDCSLNSIESIESIIVNEIVNEIVNAKTNILIDMDVNISSIDCVWQLLSSLENTFFCSGTGYDDKNVQSLVQVYYCRRKDIKEKLWSTDALLVEN
ncbi:hypothetical protein KQX54_007434 [Cotesia glomerata]|uniref:THAP-type domain-containing protein n=1 Tax=Cotesia glomerata TaxID=32391 RepID=A0AAV7HW47_COTGL|nr:hypothetical protein KQX54_007434 [Cotesia glomerata]